MTLLARTQVLKESRVESQGLKATFGHRSGRLKGTMSCPSLAGTSGVVSVGAGWPAAARLGGDPGTSLMLGPCL